MRNLTSQSVKFFLRLLAAVDHSTPDAILALGSRFGNAMKSMLGLVRIGN